MDNRFWQIFQRNMREGVHRTHGESRSRDVREVLHYLMERSLWWSGGQLLNIGIGDAEEVVLFAQAGLQVVGITNSMDEVRNASQLGVQAHCMDAHQLAFKADTFEYIYMHDTMEHFIAPIMVFAQFRRVLKMGGILAFHYPTMNDNPNWTHWFLESPRQLLEWLMKFGFRLLVYKYEPGASSEHLYIAQKIEITKELYEMGGNVIGDMIREMELFLKEQELTFIYETEAE